jgi:hypothetical protein
MLGTDPGGCGFPCFCVVAAKGATLAQLVERLIRNQQVASSILAGGSRIFNHLQAQVPYWAVRVPCATGTPCESVRLGRKVMFATASRFAIMQMWL